MLTATKTTCTCSSALPWYCDHCIQARRDHARYLRIALREAQSLKAQNAFLESHTHHPGDTIPGTDMVNCICEVLMPPTGLDLYRRALATAAYTLAAEVKRL